MMKQFIPDTPGPWLRFCLGALLAAALFVPSALAAPDVTIELAGPQSFGGFLSAGVGYIMPGGHPQILFLLAIFLTSPRTGPLATQVIAFILGHSLTLWLTGLGVIAPPASIVAWLVPATIMLAALENLLFGRVTKMKPGLVFAYGLIHGLSFGLVFLGLASAQPGNASALFGFNLGLEIAHLAIIGLALAASLYFRGVLKQASRMDLYRPMIVVPVSLAIFVTGLIWTVQAFNA
ncbi:HupE/UreJ family protein [Henriciella aquimarina]|uniref:HupE/UreJ family protein n=1 Tax=Henriciella aquimarina TaxID=545261 RepID=UPI0009FDCA99|nr:HupE/UreJ family protein [Henriciella aquimarina]